MIYNPGMINIDFADLKTILTGREPLAYLTRVESRERANVKELMEKILHNPLYPYDISRASRILFNISGPSDLSLSEVSEISQAIAQTTDRRAKVIFGVESTGKNNSLDITLLAVGCEMKNIFTGEEREEEKEEKKPLPKPEKKLIKKVVEEKIIPLLPSTKTVFKRQPVTKAKKTLKERELRTEEKKKIRKEARPLIPQKLKSMAKRGMRRGKERKNALQIQREMRENEQELLEKEEMWETPAFLRVGKQPEEKS
jgi:cell division protein FtsZ